MLCYQKSFILGHGNVLNNLITNINFSCLEGIYSLTIGKNQDFHIPLQYILSQHQILDYEINYINKTYNTNKLLTPTNTLNTYHTQYLHQFDNVIIATHQIYLKHFIQRLKKPTSITPTARISTHILKNPYYKDLNPYFYNIMYLLYNVKKNYYTN